MDNQQMSLDERQECFDAFIEEYKENSLVNKQKIVISELKELIALFQKMSSMRGITPELLVNREIIDVNREGYTQEDFVEAVYAYLQMYKELLAEFMLSLVDKDNNKAE